MKYQALKNFALNTSSGRIEILPGQEVLLQPERAASFVTAGKLKPVKPEADIQDYLKIVSEIVERINKIMVTITRRMVGLPGRKLITQTFGGKLKKPSKTLNPL